MEIKKVSFADKAFARMDAQKAKFKARSEAKKKEMNKCIRMRDKPLINAKKIGFFMAGGVLSSAASGLAQPNEGHINKTTAQGTALASILMGVLVQNLSKSSNAKTFGQGLMAAGAFKFIENKT